MFKTVPVNLDKIEELNHLLVQNDCFKSIFFKFEKGKCLPNHSHNGFATIQMISGSINIDFINGEHFLLTKGDFLPFNAKIEHNIKANELSKILVTISK